MVIIARIALWLDRHRWTFIGLLTFAVFQTLYQVAWVKTVGFMPTRWSYSDLHSTVDTVMLALSYAAIAGVIMSTTSRRFDAESWTWRSTPATDYAWLGGSITMAFVAISNLRLEFDPESTLFSAPSSYRPEYGHILAASIFAVLIAWALLEIALTAMQRRGLPAPPHPPNGDISPYQGVLDRTIAFLNRSIADRAENPESQRLDAAPEQRPLDEDESPPIMWKL